MKGSCLIEKNKEDTMNIDFVCSNIAIWKEEGINANPSILNLISQDIGNACESIDGIENIDTFKLVVDMIMSVRDVVYNVMTPDVTKIQDEVYRVLKFNIIKLVAIIGLDGVDRVINYSVQTFALVIFKHNYLTMSDKLNEIKCVSGYKKITPDDINLKNKILNKIPTVNSK